MSASLDGLCCTPAPLGKLIYRPLALRDEPNCRSAPLDGPHCPAAEVEKLNRSLLASLDGWYCPPAPLGMLDCQLLVPLEGMDCPPAPHSKSWNHLNPTRTAYCC